jgi:hypothetical protein
MDKRIKKLRKLAVEKDYAEKWESTSNKDVRMRKPPFQRLHVKMMGRGRCTQG